MLVEINEGDGVLLDLRYATDNNITGKPIYRRPAALLRPEARAALTAAVARAAVLGLRLKIFDAFRPMEAQWALWNFLPDARFVADPRDGTASHPRGVAVDVTLCEAAGCDETRDLNMGTGFDDMSPQSAQAALDVPAEAIRHRALLLGIMVATGWACVASEWWHFQLPDQAALPQLWAKDVAGGPM